MAIYHLSAKVVSRGKGQSAVAAAAYRSGDPLMDERTGELKSYERRALRIIHTEILAPPHAPERASAIVLRDDCEASAQARFQCRRDRYRFEFGSSRRL